MFISFIEGTPLFRSKRGPSNLGSSGIFEKKKMREPFWNTYWKLGGVGLLPGLLLDLNIGEIERDRDLERERERDLERDRDFERDL